MGCLAQIGMHAADVFPATVANAVFIHQIKRRSVFFCHFHRIDTGKFQVIFFVDIQIGVEHLRSSLKIYLKYFTAESNMPMLKLPSTFLYRP